jgi:hypothetical protein
LGRSLNLDVANWAAIVSAETTAQFGAAEEASAIPAGQRRRLPAFSRDVLRCALPLLRDKPRCPVILTSPHGDLHSTVTLLTDIARREILSPSLFGLSVHNAPAGALSLCLDDPGDQVSLAGDSATLSAGLVEAYARLATAEAASIVLIHAEERLPPIYAELDSAAPGVFLAMTLSLVGASADEDIAVGADRDGAIAIVHELNAGKRRLRFSPPCMQALAA